MMKHLKNNKGAAAIGQALVVAGVLGAMALSYNVLTENQAKTAKNMQQDLEMDALVNELTHILKEPIACLNTFTGTNPTGAGQTVTAIKGQDNVNRYIVATGTPPAPLYGNNSISIKEIRLGGNALQNIGWVEDPPASYQGTAYVNIQFERYGKSEGARLVTRQIKLDATLINPSNIVSACSAEFVGGTGGSGKWTPSGSDIYYNTDYVGMGPDNPSFPLTISGGAMNNDAGATRFPDGTKQSIGGVWTYHASTALTYDRGNVGIDTSSPTVLLDVGRQFANSRAAIKIGNLYMHSQANYAFFAANAYYDSVVPIWIIPDATKRSSVFYYELTTSQITFCQTQTAGVADWVCPFYIDGAGTLVGMSSCSIVTATAGCISGVMATCPAGKWNTGGGCSSGNSGLNSLYTYVSAQSFNCYRSSIVCGHVAYAICCD